MKIRQSLKSQKVFFTNNCYDVNCLQLIVLCIIYMFLTNQYVNSEHSFIHGIPEAIREMLAAENDADGCWMRL